MSLNRGLVLVFFALAVAGCGGGEEEAPDEIQMAATPEAAVRMLVEHLRAPNFTAAGRLALPDQAALAALGEGASFADVAEAIRQLDVEVAANFWAGFAQSSGAFLTGEVEVGPTSSETQNGIQFHWVTVRVDSEAERVLITRESDGHRIDLFASFGAGLAGNMIGPVERLLTTPTDDARLILSRLGDQVQSLTLAATEPDLSPQGVQSLLRLIELITRVG